MSPWHWAVVVGVALLLFGAKRLPDAARSLGRSARILRAELHAPSPSDPVPAPDGVAQPAAPVTVATAVPVAAEQPQG